MADWVDIDGGALLNRTAPQAGPGKTIGPSLSSHAWHDLRIPCSGRQNPATPGGRRLPLFPFFRRLRPIVNPYPLLRRIPRLCYLLAALTLYVLLLWMGGQENTVNHLPGRADFSKIYHLVFYGGWCGLIWMSMRQPSMLAAVGLTMAAGAGDELHQHFLSFREARISDVLLDTAAAWVAALLLAAMRRRAPTPARTPPARQPQ